MTQSSRSMSDPSILTMNNGRRCPHRMMQRYRRISTTLLHPIPPPPLSLYSNHHHHNTDESYNSKVWLHYMQSIAIRFILTLISTIGVICILTFLINYRFAIIIFNITLMIMMAIIVFFILYTLIVYYIYHRKQRSNNNGIVLMNNNNNRDNRSNQRHHQTTRNRSLSTNHLQQQNNSSSNINNISQQYHDDDEMECYQCRMERLKAIDLPPAYDPPPKYEQLNVNNLLLSSSSNLIDPQSQSRSSITIPIPMT